VGDVPIELPIQLLTIVTTHMFRTFRVFVSVRVFCASSKMIFRIMSHFRTRCVRTGCLMLVSCCLFWSHDVSAEEMPRPLINASAATLPPSPPVSNAVADMQPDEGFKELLDRIETLESNWDQQKADAAAKKKDQLKKTTFDLGGRIHYDYWGFPESSEGIGYFENPDPGPSFGVDPANRWAFRRVRLEFQGDIVQNMAWRLQIDFAETDEPAMKDVYIRFNELPNNQSFLVGQSKRPIGLDAWNSSRFNVFLERPVVVEAFNQDARRTGLAMWGYNDDTSVNWQYGIYQIENSAKDGQTIGDAMQNSLNARISGTPWYDHSSGGRGYLHLGLAFMASNYDGDANPGDPNSNAARYRTRMENRSTTRWMDTERIAGADWSEIVGLETMLSLGALHITSEMQSNWVQRDQAIAGSGPDVHFLGYYVQAAYFLTGEHIPVNRKVGSIARVKPFEDFFLVDRCDGGFGRGWGAWQVAARYSMLDLTDNDIQGGVGRNTTLAVNWWWNAYSRLQFNLIYSDLQDHEPVDGFTGGTALTAGLRFAADF